MMRSSIRRTLTFLAFTAFVPVLVMGCPKKEPVVEDAAPPTPATVPTVTELAPLTDDGGPDAADAAPEVHKKPSGPGLNANQMKIKACCNAMRAQAKAMGSSPEGFQINALAAQCDTFATQVGPAGNAPELNQLRQILKSLTLPSACQM